MGMLFPGPESSQSSAYWQDQSGTWLYATIDDLDGSPKPPQAGLPELLNELHYSLGLPIVGTWLMGLVSLLYGLALLSGVVIHRSEEPTSELQSLMRISYPVFGLKKNN